MYYYLDKDDGYAKGPYTWNDLKQIPLLGDTYIFDKPHRRWRTFYQFQTELAAANQAHQQRKPKQRQASSAASLVQTKASDYSSTSKPHPNHFPETSIPAPPFVMPGQTPEGQTTPAMGVSGRGCFILAVLFVLAVIGFIVFVAN